MCARIFSIFVSFLAVAKTCAWVSSASDAETLSTSTRTLLQVSAPNKTTATESPTESPAPSPSPSMSPTGGPTGSSKPTSPPSEAPTESPAPSPSPSMTPTFEPTKTPSSKPSLEPTITPVPTGLPSGSPTHIPTHSPSHEPSLNPTSSRAPSEGPSNLPSYRPSAQPSISSRPSASPSSKPSISSQPSLEPTFIASRTAHFSVRLDLPELLNGTESKAFEDGTQNWLESVTLQGGKLTQVAVDLNSQSIVETNTTRRQLQGAYPNAIKPELLLNFTVDAVYSGSDNDFDLYTEFYKRFTGQDTLWLRSLGQSDPIFQPLSSIFSNIQGTASASDSGISNVGLVLVLIVAVLATTVAIAAAVISIRSYNMAAYGEELQSPRDQVDVDLAQPSNSFEANTILDGDDRMRHVMSREDDFACEKGILQLVSPSTLERGCEPVDEFIDNLPFRRTATQDAVPNRPSRQDPPSSASLVGFEAKGRNEAASREDYRQRALLDATPSEVSEPSHHSATNVKNERKRDGKEHGRPSYDSTSKQPTAYTDSHELMLTKSKGGTLGAAAVDETYTPRNGSEFSSQANSFFDTIMGRNRRKENGSERRSSDGGTAAVRSLKDRSVFDTPSRRAGLYDVFAPAGPIGIVVDTTKDGPAVHSLKNTSPMLGLINPGDLIVGLDDEDTRGMTAATLTRLMAKKSNQKERKITLLASETY